MSDKRIVLAALIVPAVVAVITATPQARRDGALLAAGEQRRWTLEFQVRLEGPQRPVEMRLLGEWVSTITDVRPEGYDAALEIAGPRVAGDGMEGVAEGAREEAARRLGRRFWATYNHEGGMVAVHFFKDVNPSDRNLLQMIATAAQFVRPDVGRPVWSVMERDGAGAYLAIYNLSESNTVVKRKLKYMYTDGVAGAPVDGIHVAVDRSEFRFSLDADGGVLALDGTERVRMGWPAGDGEAAPIGASVEIHLGKALRKRAPELIGSLMQAYSQVSRSPVVTHRPDPVETQAQDDRRLLEGRTTNSLLEAAVASNNDPMLPDRLAALFRQRPEAASAALMLLRKDGPRKRITDALGMAGSRVAIEALGHLARERASSAPLRVDALTGLLRMQRPRIEAMRIAAGLLHDSEAEVQSAASLVCGALARAGRADHPAEAEAIDTALIDRYRKAQGVDEISSVLSALGNSASAAAARMIQEALGSPHYEIRAAAARALRLISGAETDHLLTAAINSDPDPHVRADAIFSASFRHPLASELGEALLRAASADPADYVRSNAVTLLRQNPTVSPRVSETLAWVAEHDANPGVRRLAQEALASIGSKSSPK